MLILCHLILSSTNLYWPSTTKYQPVPPYTLTQYFKYLLVPLIIHHLVGHSWANWIIFLFTTHLVSHAQYSSSSFPHKKLNLISFHPLPNELALISWWTKYKTYPKTSSIIFWAIIASSSVSNMISSSASHLCLPQSFPVLYLKKIGSHGLQKDRFLTVTHMKQSSCEVMVISMSSSSSSSSSTDSSSRSFSSFVWLSLSLLGETVFRLELIVVIWTSYH